MSQEIYRQRLRDRRSSPVVNPTFVPAARPQFIAPGGQDHPVTPAEKAIQASVVRLDATAAAGTAPSAVSPPSGEGDGYDLSDMLSRPAATSHAHYPHPDDE